MCLDSGSLDPNGNNSGKLMPDYTIYVSDSTYYAMDKDGNITSNASITALVNPIADKFLFFTKGTYITTEPLVPKSNGYWLLDSQAIITQPEPTTLADSHALVYIATGTVTNFTIDGGIFDGNKGALSDHRGSATWDDNFAKYHGIMFYYASFSFITVKNAVVKNCIDCGISFGEVYHGLIFNCRATGCGDNPITMEAANETFNHDGKIVLCYVDGGQDVGINVFGGHNAHIINCTAKDIDDYDGATHWGIALEDCHDCSIINPTVITSDGMATALVLTGGTQTGNKSIGGLILGLSTCYAFRLEHPHKIIGLSIYRTYNGWLYAGAEITQSQFYDSGLAASDDIGSPNAFAVVKDCIFVDSILQIDKSHVQIIGNRLQGTSQIQNQWELDVSDIWFRDNDFADVATPIDLERGAAVPSNLHFKANLGYVTESSGSSTGTGAEQTIPHGLDFTPTKEQVCVSNIDDGANPYLSSNPDATNIYVTAVDTKAYRWEVKYNA